MVLGDITNTVHAPVLRSLFFNGKTFDGLALYGMPSKDLQEIAREGGVTKGMTSTTTRHRIITSMGGESKGAYESFAAAARAEEAGAVEQQLLPDDHFVEEVDLSTCRSLAALPESIRQLSSLETLDLRGESRGGLRVLRCCRARRSSSSSAGVCRPDDDSDADDASACSEDWGYSTIPLFKKNFAKKLRSHPTKSGPVRSSSSFSSPGLRLRYRRGNMNLDGGGDLLVSVCWRSRTVDDLGGRTLSRAFI